MAVVTFRIDRILHTAQDNLRACLPLTVQANQKPRTDYSFGADRCRCRTVYQIHAADFSRLKWLAGVTVQNERSRHVCDCYGVVVARDS